LGFFKTGLGPSAFCFGPVGGGLAGSGFTWFCFGPVGGDFAGSGFAWFGLELRVDLLNFFSSALVESCPDGFDAGAFDLMLVSTSNQTYPLKPMMRVKMAALAPSCREEAVAAANWAAVEHNHVRHCKAPGQEYMYRNDDSRRSE
jgi:hypothetical protein